MTASVGRIIPSTMPGRPAPEPTSTTTPSLGSKGTSAALLRMWRSHNRGVSLGPIRPRTTPSVPSNSAKVRSFATAGPSCASTAASPPEAAAPASADPETAGSDLGAGDDTPGGRDSLIAGVLRSNDAEVAYETNGSNDASVAYARNALPECLPRRSRHGRHAARPPLRSTGRGPGFAAVSRETCDRVTLTGRQPPRFRRRLGSCVAETRRARSVGC